MDYYAICYHHPVIRAGDNVVRATLIGSLEVEGTVPALSFDTYPQQIAVVVLRFCEDRGSPQ